jgi:hypothetical protein
MSSQPGKDTIYIDVDDEITAVIDKVRSSHEKIVALVLPKRATVFQSIVNMKLLKRTADEAKKHLVLITSEAGLLPLAGSVGIYVAKTLQTRPEVPPAPGHTDRSEDQEEAVDMADGGDEKIDASRTVDSYIGGGGAAESADLDDDQPIELDNATTGAASAATGAKSKKDKGKKGGRKFAIPDFNKFRTWIVIGGAALVALILIWYFGFVVMPRATVTVKTDSMAIRANFDLELDTKAKEVDIEDGVVPAAKQETQKTASEQVEATGQKDNGTKAAGEVSMTAGACSGSAPNGVPAGTGMTANGLTFITEDSASFTPKLSGGQCSWIASAPTAIVAQNNGLNYNVSSGTKFAVVGRADVTAVGMTTGGTSQIVKVVTQADIDKASQKISAQDNSAVRTELAKALESQGLFVINETFAAGTPEITTSSKVGDEAANVSVTQKTTFSMFGAKQDHLKKLIDNAVADDIDPTKQKVIDYGLTEAIYKMQSPQPSSVLVSFSGTAIAGSDLNISEIKRQVAGKKANTAKEIIGKYPGVTEVKVDYSPFWVKSIPKKESKITITVEKPALSGDVKQQ